MSLRSAFGVPAETAGPLSNPLPTGRHERRRVAGSHAGAAPGPVGEFPAGTRPQTRLTCPRSVWPWLPLLFLPVALLAAETATLPVANGIRGSATRLSWYVHSGQWLADVRTLRAACQYLLADDHESDAQP